MAVSAKTTFSFGGGKLIDARRRGAADGVNKATERLRGHSVERAPIDQADLRGSSTVVQATPDKPTAILVFDEPYAAKQHEDETLNHTAGANGEPAGEARYVAKNYEDATRRQEYRDLIGKGIRDATGS